MSEWVVVGRILRPHGIRGGMKIETMTDNPNRFRTGNRVWLQGKERTIKTVTNLNRHTVLVLDGIQTPEAVDLLRDQELVVPEESLSPLPEGEYYRSDLVGMTVIGTRGSRIGKVRQVVELPAVDGLEIELGNGKKTLLPLDHHAVREIDRAGGQIIIDSERFDEFLE